MLGVLRELAHPALTQRYHQLAQRRLDLLCRGLRRQQATHRLPLAVSLAPWARAHLPQVQRRLPAQRLTQVA
ncbi:hypothetical protein D3C81_1358440 [compost metagenome]